MTNSKSSKENLTDHIIPILWSFKNDLLLTLISIALLWLGIETLYRFKLILPSPLSPSIGSPHRQFEVQWFQLKHYVEIHGDVDVIIIGNSSALMGIDPTELEKSYQEITEEPIQVFNFGVEGIALEAASEIGQLLIQEYQPQAIVFAGGVENFNPYVGNQASIAVLDTNWMQYKTGAFSSIGWLAENSFAFQQYLIYRNWMQPDYKKQLKTNEELKIGILENGFYPNNSRISELRDRPPTKENEIDAAVFEVYEKQAIGENNLNKFIDLAVAAQTNETVLIFVEIPKHTTFYEYFNDYPTAREEFIYTLTPIFTKYDVLFIESEGLDIVADELFVDRSHMTPKGAETFGAWLGEILGSYAANHQILNLDN